MKWLAIVAVLAVSSALVVWLSSRGAAAVLPPSVPRRAQAMEPTVAARPSQVAASEAVRVAATLEAATKARERDSAQPESILLRGRVTIVDPGGGQRSDASGTLRVDLIPDIRGDLVTCDVQRGRFELDVTGITRVSVTSALLDGHAARPLEGFTELDPTGTEVEVRFLLVPDLRLLVRDATTGLDLPDVTVQAGEAGQRHPGRLRPEAALARGDSPLKVAPTGEPRLGQRATWFVHSQGYAWGVLAVDAAAGGEREVRLSPGGDIEVDVVGDMPPRGVALRLRREGEAGGAPYAETWVGDGRVATLEALPPGGYTATAEVGRSYQARVLGRAEVEVVAGARGRFTVPLQEPAAVEDAPCSGTVVVPLAWGLDSLVVSEEPVVRSGEAGRRTNAERVAPVAQGWWTFDLGRVTIGDHRLHVSDGKHGSVLDFAVPLHVPPAGVTDVEVRIPPPATVVLELLDAATGEPADVSGVHWHVLGDVPGNLVSTYRSEDGAPFEWPAPEGRIRVGAFGGAYVTLNEELTVHAGRNELSIRLERNCPLRIEFFDGETSVPLSEFWMPGLDEIEHLDGDGRMMFVTGSSAFETALSEPGRYRITLPAMPGFEPIPDQIVTVQRGERTEVRVELVREGK